VYYDDKGRVIYTVSNDVDGSGTVRHKQYAGSQYDFAGRVLNTKHIGVNNNSEDPQLQHTEWNRSMYDMATGRLFKNYHKVDDGSWVQQASYTYDDLGRVSRKSIGNDGEVQDMTYNIRGQLNGINGYYAENGNKQGLSRSFGESIKYDYGFTRPRYDGRIAGIVWRGSSAGIGSTQQVSRRHAYGYTYDVAGRLKAADYRNWYSLTGLFWTNTNLDYSVSGLNYDKNGNIKDMKQRGVKAGTGPVDMDILHYTYENNDVSNRLQYIDDDGVPDYGAGDFQDLAGESDDYFYDKNGNLSLDRNKHITAVTYTRFNKPERVVFGDGSAIEYSYDAAGNKVEELQLPYGNPAKKTTYFGNFVYENNKVQYLNTGEGRTILQPGEPSKEEYFVKDHLGNVRSTIDVHTYPLQDYVATYEVASANMEGLMFDNLNEIREEKPLGNPGDNQAGMLNASDPARRVGTSLLLKVMAGDRVSMNVNDFIDGYDPEADQPVAPEDIMAGIVTTLTNGPGGMPGESHDASLVDKFFNPSNYLGIDNIINTTANDPTKPKAYLNYALFDENMRLVQEMTGAFQAGGNGAWEAIGTPVPLEIPENGYLAVYLTNRSNQTVYFDQLWIELSKGNLLEENHYYPHGLPITGLSSVTASVDFKENKRKYQSNEYNKDMGLNWMDFNARQYDPQIGRFLGVDPLADGGGQQVWSPYAAMGNMPEGCVDPNGTAFTVTGDDKIIRAVLDGWFGHNNYSLVGGKVEINEKQKPTALSHLTAYFIQNNIGGGTAGSAEQTAAAAADFVMLMVGDDTKSLTLKGKDNGLITLDVGYYSTGDDGIDASSVTPYMETRFSIESCVNSMLKNASKEATEAEGMPLADGAQKAVDGVTLASDVTINGAIGAQKMANSLSGTTYEVVNLSESTIIKGVTVEGASRVLGIASTLYNAGKFVAHPSWGRGLETAVSGLSLIPGWGWAVGATYFMIDIGWQASHNGKSISQTIDGE
jgi:RHS repeat-associated protein